MGSFVSPLGWIATGRPGGPPFVGALPFTAGIGVDAGTVGLLAVPDVRLLGWWANPSGKISAEWEGMLSLMHLKWSEDLVESPAAVNLYSPFFSPCFPFWSINPSSHPLSSSLHTPSRHSDPHHPT
jgi:hypothetical protein